MKTLLFLKPIFFAHEGHLHDTSSAALHWMGLFHHVVLHFPLALIVMTVISEIFFRLSKNPLFDAAARFMIVAAAIMTIPTAIFGFVLSNHTNYEGILATIFWWHRFLGITTTILAIIVAVLKELYSRKKAHTKRAYYWCLGVLFVLVLATGFLGGYLTFGSYFRQQTTVLIF